MTFTPEVLADIRQRIPENRVFNDPVSTLRSEPTPVSTA